MKESFSKIMINLFFNLKIILICMKKKFELSTFCQVIVPYNSFELVLIIQMNDKNQDVMIYSNIKINTLCNKSRNEAYRSIDIMLKKVFISRFYQSNN